MCNPGSPPGPPREYRIRGGAQGIERFLGVRADRVNKHGEG